MHFRDNRGTIKLVNNQIQNENMSQDLLTKSHSISTISSLTYDQDLVRLFLNIIIEISPEKEENGIMLHANDIAKLVCLILTKHPL